MNQNICIFIVVSLGCGWLGVLVDKFAPPQPGGETLGMAIWLVLPLLTTIALRFFAGDGWKDLGWKLNLKGNAKWYAAALLIYPLVTAVVLALGKMLGWISFSSFDAEAYAVGFVAALLPNLVKNFFEESVWRGYLTAKLLKTKIKDGWLYLIVGGVWSVWHLPYYLHFLPQADMYLILPVERLTFAIVAIASMICWTVMFVELYRLTKSIWSVVLLHVVEDSLINHLIIDGHVAIAAGKEIWISPIAGIITSLLYLGIGMWLRQRRVGSKM